MNKTVTDFGGIYCYTPSLYAPGKQHMAMENDYGVKYKSITGRLKEHFGFRLSADSKIVILWILTLLDFTCAVIHFD